MLNHGNYGPFFQRVNATLGGTNSFVDPNDLRKTKHKHKNVLLLLSKLNNNHLM
jgi:hypothetical protein